MIASLECWARLDPRRVALVDGERRWTYADLARLARRQLGGLEAIGLRPGGRVAALGFNSAELVALFFACQRAGMCLAPLNWRLSPLELGAVLDDYGPALLVYGEGFREGACALADGSGAVTAALAGLGDSAESWSRPPRSLEDAALVLYTSGTTGKPKGALLPTRMLLVNAWQTALGWGLSGEDKTVTSAPLFHTGGWNVLTLPLLLRGGEATLLGKFDAGEVVGLIAQGRASALFGVPTMFSALLEAGIERARPRFLISGGAPCPRSLLDDYHGLGLPLVQGFGMTEVGPNCFHFPMSDAEGGVKAVPMGEARRKAGTVGLPMPGTEMRLRAPDGRDAEEGELLIRGPHLFSGYLGRPEESAAALQDGWLRTGDIAARDAEGCYTVLGRRKEMYISGGENVYPAEVEAALAAHPDVAEAAVVGVPDARWGEAGLAYVALKPGRPRAAGDLLAFLQGRLARYKQPRELRLVAALPRNSMGKVLKRELR